MTPILTAPLALIGLATLPALIGIYILRSRSRPVAVSSLMLWLNPRVSPEGGARVEKFRSSLLFWLELAALLALVVAAAAPLVPTTSGARPLVVVLDDSFSMLAGAPDSPRRRAVLALLDELDRQPRGSVRLILAGDRVQLLGDAAHRAAGVKADLENWTCQASSARIDQGLALAFDLGGELATVIVLSDHAPPPKFDPESGRVRWWAFGTPRPNWAFVNASRTPGPRGDRLLLEIANLADEARSTTLRVAAQDPPGELQRTEIRLDARETHRLVLEAPEGTGAIKASLDDDALSIDNSATLIPSPNRLVRYENGVGDLTLRKAVERAIRSVGGTSPADGRAHLVFVDGDAAPPENDEGWVVRLIVEKQAEAFTGPFVLDRAHPLTEGLSLGGVVWGGGKDPLAGSPVVMAGNVTLLTDFERNGHHEIRLRLRDDLSTLTGSPAWPALIWNLVRWRSARLPGFERNNIRLGDEAIWNQSVPETEVRLRPDGQETGIRAHGRRVAFRAERPGVYTLRAGEQSADLSVNPINRDESDLTHCSTGRWGDEHDETTLRLDYRDMMWLPVLIALAIAALHLRFASRSRRMP